VASVSKAPKPPVTKAVCVVGCPKTLAEAKKRYKGKPIRFWPAWRFPVPSDGIDTVRQFIFWNVPLTARIRDTLNGLREAEEEKEPIVDLWSHWYLNEAPMSATGRLTYVDSSGMRHMRAAGE
jgi:hypothetical protein